MRKKTFATRILAAGAAAFAGFAASAAHAAFSVYYYQDGRTLNSLADADALIAETDAVATQRLDEIDISDYRTTRAEGRFRDATTMVPLDVAENFAIYAVGAFEVETAGEYTFLLHSDDGARASVNGDVIAEFSRPRAPGDTFSSPVYLEAGRHTVELTYFERRIEATLEFAYAQGAFDAFSPSAFSLVSSAPEPATWSLMIAGFALCAARLKAGRRGAPAALQAA